MMDFKMLAEGRFEAYTTQSGSRAHDHGGPNTHTRKETQLAGTLDGKVAVITGGSSGIGLATAQRFGSEGAYVFITGRRQPISVRNGDCNPSPHARSLTMTNRITSGSPESSPVIQPFGSVASSRLKLSEQVRIKSVSALNRLLAHTMAIRDLYKKAHWQVHGPTFYQLHLLFDKHHSDQLEVMDALAERIQTLGGVALALAHDVVEESRIARAPRGRESVTNQLSRLLDAHELLLEEARPLAREAAERGDDGTNDLIVSDLLRTNELQSWFVGQHLAAT